MAMHSGKILKRLDEAQKDRGKVTLYLSKSLFSKFKTKCGDHSASVVLEELMKEFIASSKINK